MSMPLFHADPRLVVRLRAQRTPTLLPGAGRCDIYSMFQDSLPIEARRAPAPVFGSAGGAGAPARAEGFVLNPEASEEALALEPLPMGCNSPAAAGSVGGSQEDGERSESIALPARALWGGDGSVAGDEGFSVYEDTAPLPPAGSHALPVRASPTPVLRDIGGFDIRRGRSARCCTCGRSPAGPDAGLRNSRDMDPDADLEG